MIILAIENDNWLKRFHSRRIFKSFLTFHPVGLSSLRDRQIIDSFYKGFYVANGTSKETSQGRFRDLDEKTLSFLSRTTENLIHDVGISSGVTSLELYEKLLSTHYRCKLFVSDKFSRFYYTGNHVLRIYDKNRTLTRAYVFSVLCDKNLHWKYFISKYSHYLLALLPHEPNDTQQIVLYDARVVQLINEGRLLEIDYDVTSSILEPQFHLVRCMNLLNPAYFSRSDLQRAIRNLKNTILEGGILQIGRTHSDGTNRVSFFRKNGDSLVCVDDVNKGSEIKSLII